MSAHVDNSARSGHARRTGARRPKPFTRLVLPVAIASGVALVVLDTDAQEMAAPLLAAINLGILCLAVLWHRDGRLPLFDVGGLCVAATVLYTVLPFLPFVVTGLTFTPATDSRLIGYGFDLHSVTALAWRYVVYLASFVVVYLAARRRTPRLPAVGLSGDAGRRTLVAVVVLLSLEYAFRWAMFLVYGLNLDVAYTELGSMIAAVSTIPYVLWQVTGIVLASMLLVKQALLLLLMRYWHSLRYRLLIVAWLSVEVGSVGLRLGARSHAVLLLLSAALLYHRAVRPIRVRTLAIGSVCLIGAFLMFGYLRGARSDTALSVSGAVAANNEFQSLFATTFDVLERKRQDTLGPVPWQVYLSDLYHVVPSQLLPFEKMDPAQWYLDVLGIRGGAVGFMFGVITQSVLGLDWIELVMRGAVLAWLFAALHRWYVARAARFWPTLLYLFIGIWSYYTMRATTFYFVHFVVYQFVPVMLATKVIAWALFGARRRSAQEVAHA